jgi:hypothetical protein
MGCLRRGSGRALAAAIARHPVVTGLVLAALVTGTVAGGTQYGQAIQLGHANTYNGTTVVSGRASAPIVSVRNTGGPALDLRVPATSAPLTVNSSRRVANLNADLLDGVHASDLQRRIGGQCPVGSAIRVVETNGTVVCGGPFARTVVVVPVAGDPVASGTALRRAVAAINTATAAEPWLIRIEPGTYALGSSALTLKPHVHLEGSGRHATILARGGVTAGVPAAVVGAHGVEVRSLSIRSSGGTNATGVSVAGAPGSLRPFRLRDVGVTASGASGRNIAIAATSAAAIEVDDAVAAASGGTTAVGADLAGARATVRATTVSASGASGRSVGVAVSRPPDVSGALTVAITGSVLAGATEALAGVASVPVRIAATEIRQGSAGGVTGAGVRCAGVHDQDFDFFASTCP